MNKQTNEVNLDGLATGSQRNPSKHFTWPSTHPMMDTEAKEQKL